jgi:chromosome segregation ATPase
MSHCLAGWGLSSRVLHGGYCSPHCLFVKGTIFAIIILDLSLIKPETMNLQSQLAQQLQKYLGMLLKALADRVELTQKVLELEQNILQLKQENDQLKQQLAADAEAEALEDQTEALEDATQLQKEKDYEQNIADLRRDLEELKTTSESERKEIQSVLDNFTAAITESEASPE